MRGARCPAPDMFQSNQSVSCRLRLVVGNKFINGRPAGAVRFLLKCLVERLKTLCSREHSARPPRGVSNKYYCPTCISNMSTRGLLSYMAGRVRILAFLYIFRSSAWACTFAGHSVAPLGRHPPLAVNLPRPIWCAFHRFSVVAPRPPDDRATTILTERTAASNSRRP